MHMFEDREDYVGNALKKSKRYLKSDNGLVSRIGGKPVWPGDDKGPDSSMLACAACGGELVLLLQIRADLNNEYCDLETERMLYVFVCTKTSCSNKKGTMKVIRAVAKKREKSLREESVIPMRIFSDGHNNDLLNGMRGDNVDILSDVQRELQLLELNKSKLEPDKSPLAPFTTHCPHEKFPPVKLEFRRRKITKETFDVESSLLKKYQRRTGEKLPLTNESHCDSLFANDEEWGKEHYEKNNLPHYTSLLKKFQNYIASDSPEQCVRYSRKSDPILITNINQSLFYPDIPLDNVEQTPYFSCCALCGSRNVFEFQIMPGIFSYISSTLTLPLQLNSSNSLNKYRSSSPLTNPSMPKSFTPPKKGHCNTISALRHPNALNQSLVLDFATVLIYTCGYDCFLTELLEPCSTQYSLELLGVQVES